MHNTKKKMNEGDSSESSEYGKRRNEEELEDAAKRSKRTQRTPGKHRNGGEDKMDLMMRMMRELMDDTREIKTNQEKYQEEFSKLRTENEQLKMENAEIKRELLNMRTGLERVERSSVRNNIIIRGLQIDTNNRSELKKDMEKFIKEKLNLQVQIGDAIRVGPKTCKIEMENSQEKQKIMENKSKLKNLKERVFIDNEPTKSELEIQQRIWDEIKEKNIKGKNVRVGYQKAVIDGKEWKWDRTEEKLKENTGGRGDIATKN